MCCTEHPFPSPRPSPLGERSLLRVEIKIVFFSLNLSLNLGPHHRIVTGSICGGSRYDDMLALILGCSDQPFGQVGARWSVGAIPIGADPLSKGRVQRRAADHDS